MCACQIKIFREVWELKELSLLLKVCKREQKLHGGLDSGALESDLDLNSGTAV